ncbi:frataxin, mitochondrial-like [Palaemon carinicauda]|uniref:frataxin, mitochondrial-like n=1 Tax=Palaemon carinicauda TaxID=392227 RepID=UPI0035B653AA
MATLYSVMDTLGSSTVEMPPLMHIQLVSMGCVTLDDITFEHVSEETLESLTEFLDELVETEECPIDADVLYSTGVLTLNLGEVGTYVINKQSPNKQIWFSSPFSGPKRYDFNNGTWVYKHDGICLHDCLSDELSKIFKRNIDMSMLAYGKSNN